MQHVWRIEVTSTTRSVRPGWPVWYRGTLPFVSSRRQSKESAFEVTRHQPRHASMASAVRQRVHWDTGRCTFLADPDGYGRPPADRQRRCPPTLRSRCQAVGGPEDVSSGALRTAPEATHVQGTSRLPTEDRHLVFHLADVVPPCPQPPPVATVQPTRHPGRAGVPTAENPGRTPQVRRLSIRRMLRADGVPRKPYPLCEALDRRVVCAWMKR